MPEVYRQSRCFIFLERDEIGEDGVRYFVKKHPNIVVTNLCASGFLQVPGTLEKKNCITLDFWEKEDFNG